MACHIIAICLCIATAHAEETLRYPEDLARSVSLAEDALADPEDQSGADPGDQSVTDAPEESDETCNKDGCDWTNYVRGFLWMLMIAMMFFAQHHVCDAYFVPAINVFVRQMKNSESKALQRWGEEAVAGATICALGCNGPELFSNLIALYTHSDAGIGVVVGSEIFNLLIIVGAATLCAPSTPLSLEKAPFVRDVFFYAVSIVLLYWCMMDDDGIHFSKACILLGAAAVYVTTVYFTTDIKDKLLGPEAAVVDLDDSKQKGKMHGIVVDIVDVAHSRMADCRQGEATNWHIDPTEAGIYSQPTTKSNNQQGTKSGARASLGFQMDTTDPLMGNMLQYKHLKEVAVLGEGVIEMLFCMGHVTRTTLRITCQSSEDRDTLLENIQAYSLGHAWVHKYAAGPQEAWGHMMHVMKGKESILAKILVIPEFIIDSILRTTLFWVDVKDTRREKRWPLCFLGAMFWLACFSFAMLEIANFINYNMPFFPVSFLGVTVCAIGTSFPNAVASVLMAKQNKPAAAIANALGSNVQNVFLAMALPWVIYSGTNCGFGSIPINKAGINEGVMWMFITLALLLVFALMPGVFTLAKWQGYTLAGGYIVYLAITSLECFGVMPHIMN